MPKRPFIRVTEIWTPARDGDSLELSRGQYGALLSFANTAVNTQFRLGEGLPGLAWVEQRPIILHDLVRPAFVREEEAVQAGLTCGIAIPIVKGSKTLAVLVLFCGDDAEHIGALEVWRAPVGSDELKLYDGYFGTASKFEFQSRHISFRKGFGLPGLTGEAGLPVIMDDLGRTKKFIRRESAETSGLTRGLGIPLQDGSEGTWILTILSAFSTPIADRFEVWQPSDDGASLTFSTGLCESGTDLTVAYDGVAVSREESVVWCAFQHGIPWISSRLDKEHPAVAASCIAAGLTRAIAIPVYRDETLTSVVAMYSK